MLCCTDKSERLKQAKREAEKEIQGYKQQREDAYQKRIKDVSPVLCTLSMLCTGLTKCLHRILG
jgi:hypothetical protein